MMRTAGFLIVCSLFLSNPSAEAQPGRGSRGGAQGGGGLSGPGGDRGQRGAGGDRGGFGRGASFGTPGGGMDTNGDGRLDAAELQRMPEGFRNMLESRGVRLQPGMSTDQFRDAMRSNFERMREERERETQQQQRGGEQPEQRPTANRTEYKPSAPFRPREKERLTIDLPAAYTELDTDFDGQVALYEWIVARRDELELFDDIDLDKDAILTPREFQSFDEAVSAEEQVAALVAKYQRPRVRIVGGPMATASGGGSKTTYLSEDVKKRHSEFAGSRAFPYIDTNKDGKITLEELQRDDKTRRVIGMFEKANIPVTPMTQQEFTQRYVQAMDHFEGLKKQGGGKEEERREGREGRGRR